jgi:hypothetical protein
VYLKYGIPQNHLKKTSLLVKVKQNIHSVWKNLVEEGQTTPPNI